MGGWEVVRTTITALGVDDVGLGIVFSTQKDAWNYITKMCKSGISGPFILKKYQLNKEL